MPTDRLRYLCAVCGRVFDTKREIDIHTWHWQHTDSESEVTGDV